MMEKKACNDGDSVAMATTRRKRPIGLSALLGAIVVGTLICPSVRGDQFVGGEGTPEDPWQIETVEQLQAMKEHLGGHFVLNNPVDASETADWNEGEGFDPVGHHWNYRFAGSLDGQGHAISGLTINRPGVPYVGLFGYVDEAGTIRNLLLEDAAVTGQSDVGALVGFLRGELSFCGGTAVVSGNDFLGGLVGTNDGVISDCHIEGEVSGRSQIGGLVGRNEPRAQIARSHADVAVSGTDSYAGGLVGSHDHLAQVIDCYATGAVSGDYHVGGLIGNGNGIVIGCAATGAVSGDNYVGGLMGMLNGDDAAVSACYATGAVVGNWAVGGLIGYNDGVVQDCYAAGRVTGSSGAGGLMGRSFGEVLQSYWDRDTTRQATSAGSDNAMGKTTAQMRRQATFEGWDFEETWDIMDRQTYPWLRNAMIDPAPDPGATPSPTPEPGLGDDYVLVYRQQGRGRIIRSDRSADFNQFIRLDEHGVEVLQGHANDTLLIARRNPRDPITPVIAFLSAPEGLSRLDSHGPIEMVQSAATIDQMTIRGAVGWISVDQARIIRIMDGHNEQSCVTIEIQHPYRFRNRELPTAISLVGVGLAELNAPDVPFSQVSSASRVSLDAERNRFISHGGIGGADSLIQVRSIQRLQAIGGDIRGEMINTDAMTAPWNNAMVRAMGMTANLGRPAPRQPFHLVALRGDIAVDHLMMPTANQVRILAVGGDIVAGQYVVGSRLMAFGAQSRRMAGQVVGGNVGAPDGPSTDLTVAVLGDPLPGASDIYQVTGTEGVNGRFYAGAMVDVDAAMLTPTFEGAVRRVLARRHGDVFLRGQLYMTSDYPEGRLFLPNMRPEVWDNNLMEIVTEASPDGAYDASLF